jgi:ubiquinone/menaquinone biosynthesis C-methylase UbiE
MQETEADRILIRHLRDLPYFRGMLRAVEDHFYQDIQLPQPVLDIGCGDGHFASVAFRQSLDIGLDPWAGPLKEANQRKCYKMVVQANAAKMPFKNESFASAVSNSVLEHIPYVDEVLSEIARVLQPGARFVFCVPNNRFTEELNGTTIFRKIGLSRASKSYSKLFNRISRHAHTDSQEVWKDRLVKTGFGIVRCWDYFPPHSLHVLEAGHFFGLPSLVVHWLTGRWILVKNKVNLWLPWLITHRHVQNPIDSMGVYSFYITQKL